MHSDSQGKSHNAFHNSCIKPTYIMEMLDKHLCLVDDTFALILNESTNTVPTTVGCGWLPLWVSLSDMLCSSPSP